MFLTPFDQPVGLTSDHPWHARPAPQSRGNECAHLLDQQFLSRKRPRLTTVCSDPLHVADGAGFRNGEHAPVVAA